MSPQLDACAGELQQNVADVGGLFSAHSEIELRTRPVPQRWSALECVIHLTLSHQPMLTELRRAVADAAGHPRKSDATYRASLVGRLVAWTLEPPPRMRVKTSAFAQPLESGGPSEVLSQFEELQRQFVELLRTCDGLAIDRTKIRSPFAPVRYDAYSAFRIIAAHNRRHLWQAREALAGR